MPQEHDEACCGKIYRNDAVRMLLGDSWHPGGLALTGQLARLACTESVHLVIDVACGTGASANFLAKEFGCKVIGLDILPENAREASSRFSENSNTNEFVVGDFLRIPLADDSFNSAILECTLSSFQNKQLVLREIQRVLKHNAKLAISDVMINGEIPSELKQAQFQDLCVAGALSIDEYCELLKSIGFGILVCQNRKKEALEFMESIRKKLFVAQLLSGIGKISVEKNAIDYARHIATLSMKAIEEDRLGYGLIVAQKK